MAILIKFEKDWADEFDVYGIRVISNERWKHLQEAIKRIEYPQSFCFGTNEELIFETPQETLRELKITEISEDEESIFKKHFGLDYKNRIEFGWTPVDQIFQSLSEQDYKEITKSKNSNK